MFIQYPTNSPAPQVITAAGRPSRRLRPPTWLAGNTSAAMTTTPASPRVVPVTLRVIKKLAPHQRGAKGLTDEYGDRMVCVRHRIDATGTQRLTTVELIISQKRISLRPSPLVEISVRFNERQLRAQLKAAGANWNPDRKVWQIRRATAMALGLKHRIVLPQAK